MDSFFVSKLPLMKLNNICFTVEFIVFVSFFMVEFVCLLLDAYLLVLFVVASLCLVDCESFWISVYGQSSLLLCCFLIYIVDDIEHILETQDKAEVDRIKANVKAK